MHRPSTGRSPLYMCFCVAAGRTCLRAPCVQYRSLPVSPRASSWVRALPCRLRQYCCSQRRRWAALWRCCWRCTPGCRWWSARPLRRQLASPSPPGSRCCSSRSFFRRTCVTTASHYCSCAGDCVDRAAATSRVWRSLHQRREWGGKRKLFCRTTQLLAAVRCVGPIDRSPGIPLTMVWVVIGTQLLLSVAGLRLARDRVRCVCGSCIIGFSVQTV